jgi:acetolactate synthase-1/2/3 large subunit
VIVAVGESPLKTHMVYQAMEAGHYLEGNVALTLQLLTQALRKLDVDAAKVAQRRTRWQAEHKTWRERLRAAEEKAATDAAITVPLVAKVLREVMPPETIYVDETIVHAGAIREHTMWEESFGFFRAPSGLGQGLGYALGVKLALPRRPVVMTIGDGTFMYNPVIPAIAFADEHKMPLLILVFNNAKYASMQYFHDKFYPAGTAIATKDYYGVNITGPKYEEAAAMVGGFAKRVERPSELKAALRQALAAIEAGKTAILNVIMPDPGNLR